MVALECFSSQASPATPSITAGPSPRDVISYHGAQLTRFTRLACQQRRPLNGAGLHAISSLPLTKFFFAGGMQRETLSTSSRCYEIKLQRKQDIPAILLKAPLSWWPQGTGEIFHKCLDPPSNIQEASLCHLDCLKNAELFFWSECSCEIQCHSTNIEWHVSASSLIH